ncbi:NAD(+) synthase [Syntrophobacteraceae bacterium DRH4]|nr:NAD(+) synthase [Desulfoferrobacter suflitae]
MEAQGVVFELRPEINSMVLARLAQKTFGEKSLGLILLTRHASERNEAALLLAKRLQLRYQVIDLGRPAEELVNIFPDAPQGQLLSRLNMAVLYQSAAAAGYAVLGTLTRNDWEIGNFTKYGDGAADLFPIVHLLASELQVIAKHLDLPDFIVQKPSAATQPSQHFTTRQLEDYLTGELARVPRDVQTKIQQAQQEALHKKLPILHQSLLEGLGVKETATEEMQEAYDKSIEALTLISKAITSDQYLEDILRLIVMVTAEVMNSSVCSLWLLDEKEAVMRLRATQSIDSEYLKDRVLRVGEGVVGKVVAENRPYVITNVLTDPYYKEKDLAKRMGLVSMLSVPMRVKERVIGVINCYTSHPHAFSDLQMNVLTTVANQAAVAIEKTELMVQTKVIQEELERRKLIERAKDLLMKRFQLPGEEAYRWLQKRSMNTRKSMREVAEAVILTMEG